MMGKWVTIGLILLGTAGGGTFGYSLLQQAAMQAKINKAMDVINQSIVTTGRLVQETSDTLQPLYETSNALSDIEQQQEQIVNNLAGMNDRLRSIGNSEQAIIAGLDSLNQVTQSASGALFSMSQVNSGILQASNVSAGQSGQEAGQVMQLNRLTQQSIAKLKELNDKLYPLRLLP
ncbi:hypothetical protein [Effusibacillus pohliae]|uniref:hypothetical protein n=1 Tax=Effusibacillus pohliae TaxID=232270 RepID=UPI000367B1EF|nr:hypothetical protein [Effusibacillus pohliae]